MTRSEIAFFTDSPEKYVDSAFYFRTSTPLPASA